MRTTIAAIAGAVCLTAAVPAGLLAQTRGQFPIAYVSVARILNETDDAKEAAKALEALRQAKAKDLAAKKQALDDTRLQIANAGGYFSGSRREQLKVQEKRQEAELQQAGQQAQTEFADLTKKYQESLRGELNKVVTAIASQRGFLYVLNQDSAVLLAPAGADITKDVLDKLNAAAAERAAAAKK